MKDRLVSVIILTYKNFDYIQRCLDSVINQTYNNIEIIIGDDGSENFPQIYENYIIDKECNNIVNYIVNRNKENKGTVKNFNSAIRLSKGEIIIPLACDDEFYDCNAINEIVKKFNTGKELIYTSKRMAIDENGNKISVYPVKEVEEFFNYDSEKLYRRLQKGNFISGACTYYSRKVFEKYGLFDENYKLLEDYPFYLKVTRNSQNIGFIDYITIKYRIGVGVSTSSKVNENLQNDYIKLFNEFIKGDRDNISRYDYREASWYFFRNYYKYNRFNLVNIKYFDIVICRAMKKVLSIMR